ncbi:hypothetical protein EYF80_023921 [Liparis tanakae]|uniref:Uncharacterized protein n=1 Tax=Liparis tanakae TaxID=230148 RepID=A0A4Z2HJZ5_9TELE|nr:hypothetical protein EYF80_023921 [Liparis tanakae]
MLLYLRDQQLDVLLEALQESLQGAGVGGAALPSPNLWQPSVLVLNLGQHLKKKNMKRYRIGEELVQLVGGGEHLRPGLHELQQVGPGLVHPVLPLGDGGGLQVAVVDELVHHLIDGRHPLLPHAARLCCKLRELLLQDLEFRRAGDHLPLSDPLLQLVHLPVELVEPVLLLQAALPLLHQLLLAQPGLHLGRVEVVLLGLVHGVQDQLPSLGLGPEQSPQLGQLVVARPDAVGLRAANGADDPRPLQDIVDPAPVALQLPLQALEETRGNEIFYLVLLHELLDCLQRGAVLLRHRHWEALLDPQLQPKQDDTVNTLHTRTPHYPGVSSHLVNFLRCQQDAPPLLQRLDQTHHPGLDNGLAASNRLLDLRLLRDGGHLHLELPHLLIPHLHLILHGLSGRRSRTTVIKTNGGNVLDGREGWRKVRGYVIMWDKVKLLVDGGKVLSLVHVGQLTLQLAQSLVQAFVALHQQVGLVGLKELAGFGLGGALQVLPAFPDLLQLPPDHRAELRLLLDQMLALLDGREERETEEPITDANLTVALQEKCHRTGNYIRF